MLEYYTITTLSVLGVVGLCFYYYCKWLNLASINKWLSETDKEIRNRGAK